jgi:hypothetical protein
MAPPDREYESWTRTDLIESGIQVVSEFYGDPSLSDDFPTTIFTRSPYE